MILVVTVACGMFYGASVLSTLVVTNSLLKLLLSYSQFVVETAKRFVLLLRYDCGFIVYGLMC